MALDRRRQTSPMASVLAFLLISGLSGVASAGADADDKRAVLLTPETFDQHMESQYEQQRPCLIMFHVSWCKVCQRAFPKFANSSDEVHSKGLTMDFAHVDCTDDKTLCQRFEVKGYPSIKLFSKKEVVPRNYKGPRNEESFLKYAERMTLPAVRTEFKDAAALASEAKGEAFSHFVAALPEGSEVPQGLAKLADSWMDRHLFAAAPVLTDILPASLQPPADAKLVSVSQGAQQWWPTQDGSEAKPAAAYYTGSLDDAAAVQTWFDHNRFAGIWMLGESCFYEFTHSNRSVVMVAVDPAKVSEQQERILRSVFDKYQDKYLFGVLDGVAWTEELRDFNIMQADLPRVMVTEDNFDVWIEDIDQLRLETLASDLKAMLDGAAILKQSRDVLSRLKFYWREAQRYMVRIRNYAEQGPMEAGIVIAGSMTAMGIVMGLGWCVLWVTKALFSIDDFDDGVLLREKKRD